MQNAAAVCKVGYRNGQLQLQKAIKWNLGSEIEVTDAEVFAISKALSMGLQKPDFDKLYIFVDSQTAIKKLQQNYIQTE